MADTLCIDMPANTACDQGDEVICSCSGTRKRQIEGLIAQGVDNLERVSRITGACSGCGACDVKVLALLSIAAR